MSRSSAAPAAWVEGASYAEAGRWIGRTNGDGVSALVKRFNNEGLEAIYPRYGGGYHKYSEADYTRILDEAARLPSVEREVTAQWSLTRLQKVMRQAVDGLPEVSSETIGRANGKRIEHARI